MSSNKANIKDVLEGVANSKAAEKLAQTICNIVDYTAGPKRMVKIAEARAASDIINARAQTEIECLRHQAASRLLDKEVRNQQNIEAITAEAFKALPPSDQQQCLSDEQVSEDFVYRFFDECQGISDEEMQQLWGRLLAGEVMKPGSFHPRTLRVVKDMRRDDARQFSKLCNFSWQTSEGSTPIIINLGDSVYKDNGLNFDVMRHLEALGLVQFETVASFVQEEDTQEIIIRYSDKDVTVRDDSGTIKLFIGQALFTEAGQQLSKLCVAEEVPSFLDYVVQQWISEGYLVSY